jgi:predicted AlkP superfamily pyrophosphatase or phosphodiesterase
MAQRPPPPKLLVVIRVDGLSSDLFAQYLPQFGGGFSELGSGATYSNATRGTSSGRPLGDLVKAQWPASRSVVVSGTRSGDPSEAGQRFYWAGSGFVSYSGVTAPPIVSKVNAAIASALAHPRPALELTAFCGSKTAKGGGLARAAGDAARLAASPELDGDTLALAAALVDSMKLGRGAAPDVLSVGLSATANVAQTYGTEGQEMCLQLTELDREIADFLSVLDSRGIDYAVTLYGGGDQRVPMLFWRPGFTGATIRAPASTDDITPTLAALVELPLPASVGGRCLEGTPAFCQR